MSRSSLYVTGVQGKSVGDLSGAVTPPAMHEYSLGERRRSTAVT